jgi:hypothetical protein
MHYYCLFVVENLLSKKVCEKIYKTISISKYIYSNRIAMSRVMYADMKYY